MVHPSWWAVVWISSEGEAQDVVRVDNWGGAIKLREELMGCSDNYHLDLFDHRGRLVFGLQNDQACDLMAPIGGPVMMHPPMVEGRWLWHEDGSYTREPNAPTRRVVEWAAHAELRGPSEDVLVVPYDLEPNPVSIAMRLRKRIYDEEFARRNASDAP